MSDTKRKLMGLLSLGTMALGSVNPGSTSADKSAIGKVTDWLFGSSATEKMKEKADEVVEAARGYGAAIRLAKYLCALSESEIKEGVMKILSEELEKLTSCDEKGKYDGINILMEEGNLLLKVAYDIGFEDEEIEKVFSNIEDYRKLDVTIDQNNSKNVVNLYDTFSAKVFLNSFRRALNGTSSSQFERNDEDTEVYAFNLFLSSSRSLVLKNERSDKLKEFIFNISYYSTYKEKNYETVRQAIKGLKEKILEKLSKNEGLNYDKAIGAIMQIIATKRGANYFKSIIEQLMGIKVGEKKFSQSKYFRDLMNDLMRNKSTEDKSQDLKKGDLSVFDDMMRFSNDNEVLLEVINILGYNTGLKDKILGSKYFRFALCTGAISCIASVAGIPVASTAFVKLAVSCYFGVKLLDLRHQSFAQYIGNNVSDIVFGTVKVAKATSAVIGGISSLFGRNSWT